MDRLRVPGMVKYVVKFMNLMLFLWHPRKFTNTRWGHILNDTAWESVDFMKKQFFKVYLRVSTKHRYHPLQMRHSAQRSIDPREPLERCMAANGTGEYYSALPSSRNGLAVNCPADLAKHKHCESLRGMVDAASALARVTSGDSAELAAELVTDGLTREIAVDDGEDWQQLRLQLRDMTPAVKLSPASITHDVFPFAVSYKAKEETFITNVLLLPRDQEVDDDIREEVEMTQKMIRTSDFLDDRRWEQLQRAVGAYARKNNYRKVCLWIDRLINVGKSDEKLHPKLNWVEYGLYPYMLMPTVRVYDPSEAEFGTTFWRKVEATLAVSGKGLICDDYMIRKYNDSLYYDETLSERLHNGIIRIGGKTNYVRSTILALATMIITDGITITKANEHPNSRSSIVQWKSWAIRCVTQEAFSHGPAVPICNEPVTLDLNGFKLLSSWEFDLCHSEEMTGGSYLDMTAARSMTWSMASGWDGISEWIGMMGSAFNMDENNRDAVMTYLDSNTNIAMYAAASGHTAAHITLKNESDKVLKSLVVDTSRFSTARHGHVIAVADATGHGDRRIVPWYLTQVPDPDENQVVTIDDGEVQYEYKTMKVRLAIPKWVKITLTVITFYFILVASTVGVFVSLPLPFLVIWWWAWPWADYADVGEALFDNLLLHSLFGSGIKKIYREIHTDGYRKIQWK